MFAAWALLLACRLKQEVSMARLASRLVSWCVQRSFGAWREADVDMGWQCVGTGEAQVNHFA